jgi:hypothetical protein
VGAPSASGSAPQTRQSPGSAARAQPGAGPGQPLYNESGQSDGISRWHRTARIEGLR